MYGCKVCFFPVLNPINLKWHWSKLYLIIRISLWLSSDLVHLFSCIQNKISWLYKKAKMPQSKIHSPMEWGTDYLYILYLNYFGCCTNKTAKFTLRLLHPSFFNLRPSPLPFYMVSHFPKFLPAGNLVISQEIQPKCPVGSYKIVSEGGKGTLNYYMSNSVGL